MYHLFDTRTGNRIDLAGALITSQPKSGGLWAPTEFPHIHTDLIAKMQEMSFQSLAKTIGASFGRYGLQEDVYSGIIDSAYGNQWHHSDITPVKKIGSTNLYSLHLGYGPTFAFKNIALEFLPRLLTELTDHKPTNVVGASSGDTVNAAHHGVNGTSISSIFMLPNTGPSVVQKIQAQNGISNNPNAITILADAPFDPLQDVVKTLNSKPYSDFKTEYNITSFNSINIGRILAQVVYYFRAYSQLLKTQDISNGDEVIFSVPSGNFGDALAGYYAKKMGLPIQKIIVATNENNMLEKFIKTGVYEPPKKQGVDYIKTTNAPSMDIAKASNFERMLFDMHDGDYNAINKLYTQLVNKGNFQVKPDILEKIQNTFMATSSTDQQREGVIRYMAKAYGQGIDPHTAAGVFPWIEDESGLQEGPTPVIFLETSHVAQFSEELKARNIVVPGMDEFDDIIEAMKQNTPVEGRDFLYSDGDFDSLYQAIQKAIQIVDGKISASNT